MTFFQGTRDGDLGSGTHSAAGLAPGEDEQRGGGAAVTSLTPLDPSQSLGMTVTWVLARIVRLAMEPAETAAYGLGMYSCNVLPTELPRCTESMTAASHPPRGMTVRFGSRSRFS